MNACIYLNILIQKVYYLYKGRPRRVEVDLGWRNPLGGGASGIRLPYYIVRGVYRINSQFGTWELGKKQLSHDTHCLLPLTKSSRSGQAARWCLQRRLLCDVMWFPQKFPMREIYLLSDVRLISKIFTNRITRRNQLYHTSTPISQIYFCLE